MANTAVLFSLGALALVCWILGEVIGNFNPKIAGFIKIMAALIAVGMVIDKVLDIFNKVKTFSQGL